MELANIFYVGAAQVEITPPLGTIINGDFKAHYAKTINDPLFAKAIVLHKGETWVALVVVDICVMPKRYVDELRSNIAAELDIPFGNILISSTHTHAAGSVAEAYLSAVDSAYSRMLPPLVLAAVKQAKERVEPAKIAFGEVDVPAHVRSRRYELNKYVPVSPVTGKEEKVKTNPFGLEQYIKRPSTPTDPGLSYLAIQNLEGKWISVLANYSLHYVGDWENGTISADYFGEFAAQLKVKLEADDDFVGIMSNGTSGDINIWEFIKQENYPAQHFEKSKYIAKDLVEKLNVSLKTVTWNESPDLNVQFKEVEVSCRKPNADELEAAKTIVANSDYHHIGYDDESLKQIYAREQLLLNEYPNAILLPIQLLKIGDGLIGGLAGEFFASTGLWLKENMKVKNYFTISMANGNCGYVPPPSAFENGGYETWRSRTSYLDTNAEVLIKDKLVELKNHLGNS